MENSFYTKKELATLGLKSYGEKVLISKKCSLYDTPNIEIGNNVRIDDFCILSGKIKIGNNIHISAHSSLYASDVGIICDDFTTISGRCALYAISDNYIGDSLTNSTVPEEYKKLIKSPIKLNKHCIIGTNCTILPGVNIAEGTAVGAMSLIKSDTTAWKIYAGIPAKIIADRNNKVILALEVAYKQSPHYIP